MKNCTTCKHYCSNSDVQSGMLGIRFYCSFGPKFVVMQTPISNCEHYKSRDEKTESKENPKPIEEKTVDWNQRRYELSKEFMSVIMGRANYDPMTAHYNYCACGCSEEEENNNPYLSVAQLSVAAADALIDTLKGKEVRDEK